MNLARDKFFALWGHSHLLGTGWQGKKTDLVNRIFNLVGRTAKSNAYYLDEDSAQQHFEKILRFKPRVILSYSAALDMLVRHNTGKRQAARRIGLKFVIATAEPLPRPDTRDIVEDFFGAPLIMEYGAVDFGCVAYEKLETGYHVFWWSQLAEVNPSDGSANKLQPLIVTNLFVRYMPLIRYYTGDEVSGAEPSRSRGILRFNHVEGRCNDVVEIGGTLIHSVALFHCIHQEKNIISIQLVLEDDGPRLSLVGQKDETTEKRIRQRLRELHPPLEDCRIDYRSDVETTLAGKRRWILDRRSLRSTLSS